MLRGNIIIEGGDNMFEKVNGTIETKEIKDAFCDYCFFCDWPMDLCNCDTFFDD